MDVLLISTTDLEAARGGELQRMLQALSETQRALGDHRLTLYLLLQNCRPEKLAALTASLPQFVRLVSTPGRIPLSAARNILLRSALGAGAIDAEALVAFPDDDSWYPAGFLGQVVELFARDPQLDFWYCRYASRPLRISFARQDLRVVRGGQIVRDVSSNTMFLRGRVVTAIGEFDEELGIGTPLGGAEDLDYALRAVQVARKTAYRDAALVGHRDKSPAVRTRYYRSGLLVLARYARQGVARQLVRKIAVGMYFVLRGQLPPASFVAALRTALAELRHARRGPLLRPISLDR